MKRHVKQAVRNLQAQKKDAISRGVENFKRNVTSLPQSFATVGRAIKAGKLGELVEKDLNPVGKRVLGAIRRMK